MMRISSFAFGCFAFMLSVDQASAACPAPPVTNGTTANADKVIDLLDCRAPLAGPAFTGNVGIGTSNPQGSMDVKNAAGGATVIRAGVNGNGFTLLGDGYWNTQSQFNLGLLYSSANGFLGFADVYKLG